MGIYLESDIATAEILLKGAELCSFQLKNSPVEYIWQGDSQYWGRHAPVLFPIVGRLKQDTYQYEGNFYSMPQHGFARDQMFEIIEHSPQKIVLQLENNSETQKNYPFEFCLKITYELEEAELSISYDISTTSDELYFSIGAHPAFNVPLIEGTEFTDYYLKFDPLKSRTQIPLKTNLIDLSNKTLAQTNTLIGLNHSLFENDALIYEERNEKSQISILSDQHTHGIKVTYEEFPFVGIWSPYSSKAPFICIEPWCGIADDVKTTGDLSQKYGINCLKKGDRFIKSYKIEIM